MIKGFKFLKITTLILLLSLPISVNSEEEEIYLKSISDQIQVITKDLKTLEKAVYQKSDIASTPVKADGLNEDILTKHLLKLNEIENQFRELTNKFEEVNFKLDKLSTRVTKIQSDTQLRFSDLESGSISKTQKTQKTQANLPGTSKPKILEQTRISNVKSSKQQTINSVKRSNCNYTRSRKERVLLPNKPQEQYEFAVSFMKIGDYETAEFALKEFIDKNKDHDLAGSAQYWYGETFRIRQLYSDAATAYLDGYQNYPKSKKAPDNLLKLGITMVQLGEKEV